MKDLPALMLLTLAQLPAADNRDFWERVLEKWGIGLIGMGLFCALGYWTYKRDCDTLAKREKKEEEEAKLKVAEQAKKDALEAEDRAERIRLAQENNRLTRELLDGQYKAAKEVADVSNKSAAAIDKLSAAMSAQTESVKMMMRSYENRSSKKDSDV